MVACQQKNHISYTSWRVSYTAPQEALYYRQCFVMAEKQEHPSARDLHSCSSKLVCPLSLVSLLICTAALVRVEIINQRVHVVEDLVADAEQNQNAIKVFTDASSLRRSERVESVGGFDHKIAEERTDDTEG